MKSIPEKMGVEIKIIQGMLRRFIVGYVADHQCIPWETIIKLIEVYHMTQQLENSWVKEIFTPEELKQYATFETELKKNSTPEQLVAFQKNWFDLVAEIKENLDRNPQSAIGITIGKKCMQWLNKVYGRKYANLRTKKFKKGFVEGKGLNDAGLTPKIVAWMDKAVDAYWKDRIYEIFNQLDSGVSHKNILKLWNEVLVEMYGDDNSRKKEIYDLALADEKISKNAKEWLKKLRDQALTYPH